MKAGAERWVWAWRIAMTQYLERWVGAMEKCNDTAPLLVLNLFEK